MRPRTLLLATLALVAAGIVAIVLRDSARSDALAPPERREESARTGTLAAPEDDGPRASAEERTAPAATPDASERQEVADAAPIRGVARDERTGKVLPFAPLTVSRDERSERLLTGRDGDFTTPGAWTSGPVRFELGDARHLGHGGWLRGRRIDPVDLVHDTLAEASAEPRFDAPDFIVVDDVPAALLDAGRRIRAMLVLPGAEEPGEDGTTWVPPEHRLFASRVAVLPDDSVIAVFGGIEEWKRGDGLASPWPARFDGADGRVELFADAVTSIWCIGPGIEVRGGAILTLRVPARERAGWSQLVVSVADTHGEPVANAVIDVVAHERLDPRDAPAIHRNGPDWAFAYPVEAGATERTLRTDHEGRFRSDFLPPGERLLTVRHPLVREQRRTVLLAEGAIISERFELERLPVGAPLRIQVRWTDPAAPKSRIVWSVKSLRTDGTAFDPGRTHTDLGEDGSGILDPAPSGVAEFVLEELPEGRYRIELSARSYPGVGWGWASRVQPSAVVLRSGEAAEVLVENDGLAYWEIRLAWSSEFEGSPLAYPRQGRLRVLDADGTLRGQRTLVFDWDGVSRTVAPAGRDLSFVFEPLKWDDVERSGSFVAAHTLVEEGRTWRVLEIR